jgi:hypothetical protein
LLTRGHASAIQPVSFVDRADLERLEAGFDAMWRAREHLLVALEGKKRRTAPEPSAEAQPARHRRDVIAQCREEALRLVHDELATIERRLDGREWQMSPLTLRLRRDRQRLLALQAELER